MRGEDRYVDGMLERSVVEMNERWLEWYPKIPFLDFPEDWLIAVMPPFGGALVRFNVRKRGDWSPTISVYLDCFNRLGFMNEPYWEVYPIRGEPYRCELNETLVLLTLIAEGLEEPGEEEV